MQEVMSVADSARLDDLGPVCLVSDGDIQDRAVTVIKNEYMDITKQELDIAVGHGSMSFMFMP
jgi:predicted ABC-class ATPase